MQKLDGCPQHELQRLGSEVQLDPQRLKGFPPCLCSFFLFLLLLLLLECRLLVSVLSPHEVEGGGESTTGEGEVVFWCPWYKELSWEASGAFRTVGVENNHTGRPRVNLGRFRVASCWLMKDSLMPSFQRISSYRLQHILLWGWDLEFYDSTLGIVVLNGNFPRYWVVGNTLMSPTQWILQVFDFKSL